MTDRKMKYVQNFTHIHRADLSDFVHSSLIITAVVAKSWRRPKIMAHAQNHGIYGDHDIVIYLEP